MVFGGVRDVRREFVGCGKSACEVGEVYSWGMGVGIWLGNRGTERACEV